jgi:1,4-dihydroxy-2-naphthoate polyprenyltransferase
MTQTDQQFTPFSAWLVAARPRTLPLAVACMAMGIFLAAADGVLNGLVALLALLTAVFLQILSNLANDYGDYVHGADRAGRVGPQRAVQSGLITPAAMRAAMVVLALLSLVAGVVLLWLALGSNALIAFVIFGLLGLAAIGAAVTYTAGKMPYGYAGLGDIAVLLFFGWVAVLGTYFLQAQSLRWNLFLPATSVGLLAVAVLNVNNIRDIDSDARAGKRSIPVRLGPQRARLYHWALLLLSLTAATLYVLLHFTSWWQFLFLLTLPLFWRNGTAVAQAQTPAELNPWLKNTVMLTLLFVFTFGIGQLL